MTRSFLVLEPNPDGHGNAEIAELPADGAAGVQGLDITAASLFIGREVHGEVLRRLLLMLVFEPPAPPAPGSVEYVTARGRTVARLHFWFDSYSWSLEAGPAYPGAGAGVELLTRGNRDIDSAEIAQAEIAAALSTLGYVVRRLGP